MSLKNASVIITYELLGALAESGSYDYREKTTAGSILPEDQRLFVTRPMKLCDCHMRVHLNEKFVNWAISDDARPGREDGSFRSYKAYTFWRQWNDLQRLTYQIVKYCLDMGSSEYTYVINEE